MTGFTVDKTETSVEKMELLHGTSNYCMASPIQMNLCLKVSIVCIKANKATSPVTTPYLFIEIDCVSF